MLTPGVGRWGVDPPGAVLKREKSQTGRVMRRSLCSRSI